MTEVVVTEANKSTVIVDDKQATIIVTGIMPPPLAVSMSNIVDIDISQLQDGGVLVYDSATQKWAATNTFEKQIFEAGQF